MIQQQNEWREVMSSMNKISTIGYWNGRAEDYDDFIRTSRFSYGEQIARILMKNNFLQENMNIFEIAGGVGALTLPLCRHVNHVTTVEPAEKMAEKLLVNAKEQNIHNVNVLVETCQETAVSDHVKIHDAAVMCHASWQFPDLLWLVKFMEKIGGGRVCLADSFPKHDNGKIKFYEDLGISDSSFDRFHALQNTLKSFNRTPEMTIFPFTMKRSMKSAKAMISQVLGKYRKPALWDIKKIDDFVEMHSASGIYEEEAMMGVLWWQVE